MTPFIPAPVTADGDGHAQLDRHLALLRAAVAGPSPDAALRRYDEVQLELDGFMGALKGRLFESSLTWTDEDMQANRWIQSTYEGVARLGQRLLDSAPLIPGDPRAARLSVLTLHHIGEALKCEIATGRKHAHDYRSLHAILKRAIFAGHHRDPVHLRVEGRLVKCCVESLYFRALLLARFASGNLDCRQVEILDAWLWQWMSILLSVEGPAPGAELSVDLDSDSGLWRGARFGVGRGLHLARGPLEDAFRAVIGDLHQGRMAPAEGLAAGFRMEERVVVLDLLRRGLRKREGGSCTRAERRPGAGAVEMHVGITEIAARAFLPCAPRAIEVEAAVESLVASRARRQDDDPTGEVYERRRRRLKVLDVSSSGLGLEGERAQCAEVCVGDLVAIRSAQEGLVFGKVVRVVPSGADRTVIGVQRFEGSIMPVTFAQNARGASARSFDLLHVSGEDDSGRHDAFLVSERLYAERGTLEVAADGEVFAFRFNRVRERGRGWVLAGFEIVAMQRAEHGRAVPGAGRDYSAATRA